MNIFKLLTQINSKQDRQPQKNHSQSAFERSLLLNLTKLSSAALIAVLFPFGQKAFAAITIMPKFSNIFYMDDDASPNIRGMYIAYQITNDGTARDDVWAKINVPAFGSSANITLGQNEDGVVQLGPMAANETKTAFFYLHTPVNMGGQNGNLPISDSHNLTVYDTRPNQPGANIIDSTSFSFVELQDTTEASANKVTNVVTGPNPAELGGVITMTVTGETGTIGSGKEMAFSPATYSDWPGNAFELFDTKIQFAATGAVYNNTLSFTYTNTTASQYTATYKFRAVNTTSQPSTVSPVGEIQSGTQIKHTSSGNFATFAKIQPPVNYVTLTKLASSSQLTNGGTVTYTLRLNNTGSTDVVVQEMRDTLPTTPGVVTYAGQATYNGVAIADPTISGSTLTWVGSFTVPAGTSRDLTFKATIPDTEGNYVNSSIAFIGNAQLDTTLDTTNNSPSTTTITELPSDYGDAPSLYGSANHGIPTTPTIYLGSVKPDKESSTQLGTDSGAAAAGDDGNNTDDEDAFTALANVPTIGNYSLNVPVTNTSGGNATLHAWIDFNKNSKFEAGEYQSATVANNNTSASLNWTVPTGTLPGSTHARFRLTNDNILTDDTGTGNQDERSIGAASNGEVEDYPVSISVPIYDYGDAPDTGVGTGTGNYKTTTNDGGAAQVVISTLGQVLSLGNNIDVDDGSLQNSTADADDNNDTTDDEDGVSNFPALTTTANQTYTVPVSVKNNVPLPNAYLVGYIDFNKDGDFNDTGEKSTTVTVPTDSITNPRTFDVTFTTPAGMTVGNTYARFRLGQVQATAESATGVSASTDNGEIEDYQVSISAPSYDYGDAPTSYGDASHDNPATPTVYLGSTKPDQESGTQLGTDSGAAAAGDDNNGTPDDEDAFTILANVSTIDNYDILVPVRNTSGGNATLYAWVDFNKNGKFEAGEYTSSTVANNTTTVQLNWTIPSGTTSGDTYIRFRLTTDTLSDAPGTSNQDERSIGNASNGEVEDYKVTIEPVPSLPPPSVASCEVAITNGSFESPSLATTPPTPYQTFVTNKIAAYNENDVPGWTSFADSYIELWRNGNNTSGNPPAYEGEQFAEINAYVNGSLYQDVYTTPGSIITWQFAHRGRAGIDTMNLKIGSPGATVAQINPTNGTTLFQTGNTAWVVYQGTYTVPAGQTTTRFEYKAVATASGNTSIGNFIDAALFGPLCDHGDAKSDYPVLRNNSGAAHVNDGVTFLGSKVRIELDGQPSAASDGDDGIVGDGDQIDDEDGVTFTTSTLNAGSTSSVDIVASVPGYLNAWIDFNQDNDWDDLGEKIFTDRSLNAGTNNLSLAIPANANIGNTFARFRFSTNGGINPTGIVANGEVEDYQIAIAQASDPNLLLVKRITAINPGQAGQVQFNAFVDDSGTTNDNNTKWPDSDSTTNNNNSINTYLRGAISVPQIKPGDEVEYTIYFLSNGDADAKNVKICDVVPDNMTFNKHSYGTEVGINLALDTTSLPTDLSNLIDLDEGSFYPPGTNPPVINLCKKHNPSDPNNLINVNNANNLSGAVLINLSTAIPPATGSGTPTNSYGFIRFRAKVK
jgi:uncharacterized repeat protein (TIGR01451 family)